MKDICYIRKNGHHGITYYKGTPETLTSNFYCRLSCGHEKNKSINITPKTCDSLIKNLNKSFEVTQKNKYYCGPDYVEEITEEKYLSAKLEGYDCIEL